MAPNSASDDFYRTAPIFRDFRLVADEFSFSPLPEDWLIGVADVEQSTKAIQDKRYKAVNMAGAAVVAAVANALGGRDFPFVFGGDGASFNWADYGQKGSPLNPGGDPPVGVGGTQTPPLAEGGALRSQDLRTSGDPVSLDGTLLRIDPATGRPVEMPGIRYENGPIAIRPSRIGMHNWQEKSINPATGLVYAATMADGAPCSSNHEAGQVFFRGATT